MLPVLRYAQAFPRLIRRGSLRSLQGELTTATLLHPADARRDEQLRIRGCCALAPDAWAGSFATAGLQAAPYSRLLIPLGRLYRVSHFFERLGLDLPDTLTRHAELVRECIERRRIIGQATRLEDAPFARA